MTIAQIAAILSILTAFGLDAGSVDHIRTLITPVEASTTPVYFIPIVQQAPLQEQQPLYLSNSAPIITPKITQTAMPQDQSEIIVHNDTQYVSQENRGENFRYYSIFYKNADGKIDGTHAITLDVDSDQIKSYANMSNLSSYDMEHAVLSPNNQPGITFGYAFPAPDSTLTINVNGMTKVVPITQ